VQGTSVYYSIGDPLIIKIFDIICNSLEEALRAQAEGFGYKLMPRRTCR